MNSVPLKSVSKSIKKLIKEMDSRIDWTQDGYISLDGGSWLIEIADESAKEIKLSVNIDMCPTLAVATSIAVCDFAKRNRMKVSAGECFVNEFNEHGRFLGLVFGQKAYQMVGRQPYGGCCN